MSVIVTVAVIVPVLMAAAMFGVTAPVPHLVPVETSMRMVGPVIAVPPVTLPPMRESAAVSEAWIIMPVDVAMEMLRAPKPRSGSQKHPALEPLGAIVAVGCTVIRRVVVVTVRTDWRWPDLHRDLRMSRRTSTQQEGRGRCRSQEPRRLLPEETHHVYPLWVHSVRPNG